MKLIEQASSFAADIDNVIFIVFALGGFWLIVAEVVFLGFIVKYRKKKGVKASYISGEEHSEKKIPHLIHYAIIALDVVILYFAIAVWYDIKQDIKPAEDTVQVVGFQWAWKFVHAGADRKLGTADDIAMVDELHLENGKTYQYFLESEDVLHNFSIPVFRLKQDAVPGRRIVGWFTPIKEGTYDLQCAEICGIGHGVMNATVTVHSPEDYQAWLEEHTPAAGFAAAN